MQSTALPPTQARVVVSKVCACSVRLQWVNKLQMSVEYLGRYHQGHPGSNDWHEEIGHGQKSINEPIRRLARQIQHHDCPRPCATGSNKPNRPRSASCRTHAAG